MKSLKLKIENYEFEVPVFEQDGKHWFALNPLCDIIGVDRGTQTRKVLSSELIRVCHMTLPSAGGAQSMLCVEIDSIGEWIFGINPNKVKPEIRERMYLFRKKLQAVLYAAVTGHSDINQVASLVEEVRQLRQIVEQQSQVIEYLVRKDALSEQYVDKRLASVGGKLLSSMSHKRRRAPEPA